MADKTAMLGAGMDTTRMPSAAEDRAIRDESRRGARGNLAAILVDAAGGLAAVAADPRLIRDVAAEFGELCDLLGLPTAAENTAVRQPERLPGMCGYCGEEMPVISLSGHGGSAAVRRARAAGFCSQRCHRTSRIRPREEAS